MGRWTTVCAAVGLFAISATVGARPAAAELAGFEGSAASSGVQFLTTVKPGVGFERVNVAAPTAETTVTSRGNSAGSASLPFPGEPVVGAPGLLTLLQVLPPTTPTVPGYPLQVSSTSPDAPEEAVDAGPYTLRSTSGPNSGEAEAAITAGEASSRSSASVDVDGDTVTAAAESVVDGAVFGPLSLGRVRTWATAVGTGDQDVVLDGAVEVDGATVGDVAVDIGPDGITVAGQTVPFDRAASDPVLQAVGLGGITVELLPIERTDATVTTGGLRLTRTVPGDLVGTTVTVEMVLGSASATADPVAARPPVASGGVGSPPAPPAPEVATCAGDAVRPAAPAPVPPAPPAVSASIARAPEVIDVRRFSAASFYPVLVAAGIAMSAAAQLVRRQG